MDRKFWISVLALLVLSLVLGFVVHGWLLGSEYAPLTGLFRTPAEQHGYFLWIVLAHALIAVGLTWIYRKGLEPGKPLIGQGLRFGLAIAVLMTVPTYLIYYAVQPMPGALVAKQIVYDVIAVLILGVVVAWINQPPRAA
jgi:magnesium-transporting ATPase (P-type)